MANLRVTVEIGDERYDAVATPSEGEERDRLWTMLTENYPFFADHQANIERIIPVVALTRA